MITKEEERRIIDTAKEEILLTLPDVWSSLFLEMKSQGELYTKFYTDNPDLAQHKDAVKAIMGDITGRFPNLDHSAQIKKALPKIRQRIADTKNIPMTVNPSPDTDFKPLEATIDTNNGAI
ncbi:MAG: hypothetical protein DRH93_03295 [Deltaproteobacteria bacterium]|nr:MAG: hypothetical protein DRH93_03295 [Deltaproteobacteria bacterium]